MNQNMSVDEFLAFVDSNLPPVSSAAKEHRPEYGWKRRPTPMWDTISGLAFCRALERALDGRWHVAMGGSVMYAGFSGKDLDVVVRPHGPLRPYQAEISAVMTAAGFTKTTHGEDYDCDGPNIQVWTKTEGELGKNIKTYRVDLFIFGGRVDTPIPANTAQPTEAELLTLAEEMELLTLAEEIGLTRGPAPLPH